MPVIDAAVNSVTFGASLYSGRFSGSVTAKLTPERSSVPSARIHVSPPKSAAHEPRTVQERLTVPLTANQITPPSSSRSPPGYVLRLLWNTRLPSSQRVGPP